MDATTAAIFGGSDPFGGGASTPPEGTPSGTQPGSQTRELSVAYEELLNELGKVFDKEQFDDLVYTEAQYRASDPARRTSILDNISAELSTLRDASKLDSAVDQRLTTLLAELPGLKVEVKSVEPDERVRTRNEAVQEVESERAAFEATVSTLDPDQKTRLAALDAELALKKEAWTKASADGVFPGEELNRALKRACDALSGFLTSAKSTKTPEPTPSAPNTPPPSDVALSKPYRPDQPPAPTAADARAKLDSVLSENTRNGGRSVTWHDADGTLTIGKKDDSAGQIVFYLSTDSTRMTGTQFMNALVLAVSVLHSDPRRALSLLQDIQVREAGIVKPPVIKLPDPATVKIKDGIDYIPFGELIADTFRSAGGDCTLVPADAMSASEVAGDSSVLLDALRGQFRWTVRLPSGPQLADEFVEVSFCRGPDGPTRVVALTASDQRIDMDLAHSKLDPAIEVAHIKALLTKFVAGDRSLALLQHSLPEIDSRILTSFVLELLQPSVVNSELARRGRGIDGAGCLDITGLTIDNIAHPTRQIHYLQVEWEPCKSGLLAAAVPVLELATA